MPTTAPGIAGNEWSSIWQTSRLVSLAIAPISDRDRLDGLLTCRRFRRLLLHLYEAGRPRRHLLPAGLYYVKTVTANGIFAVIVLRPCPLSGLVLQSGRSREQTCSSAIESHGRNSGVSPRGPGVRGRIVVTHCLVCTR